MEHTYSPKNFSKLVGVSVFTLQRWDRNGTLTAHRTPTNRRYYTHDQYLQYRGLISNEQGKTIAYARVSSPSQKKDLLMQKDALRAYCLEQRIQVDQWIEDIGSALNYQRTGFNQVIEEIELGHVKRVVIGYEDRFVRFGYDWFEPTGNLEYRRGIRKPSIPANGTQKAASGQQTSSPSANGIKEP
jgi:putative resolvase